MMYVPVLIVGGGINAFIWRVDATQLYFRYDGELGGVGVRLSW